MRGGLRVDLLAMVLGRWFTRAHRAPLGELEAVLMEQLWAAGGEVSVREAHQRHGGKLAYTTVMTTLDRLYKKGLLRRRKDGRAFFYSAALTREEFAAQVARQALEFMGSYAGRGAVLSTLVDAVSEADARLLDELERLVQSKRRQERQRRPS